MVNTDRKLVIKSEYERLVFGEVYAPRHADTYEDAMTSAEVKKAAYNFMKKMRNDRIDLMHNEEETGSYVVESFLARSGDPDGFIEGAWVVGVKVENDGIWNQIVKGEINGFSLSGTATVNTRKVPVDHVTYASGTTELSMDALLPDHYHDFSIEFDEDGKILPTTTSDVLNHTHPILMATATEMAYDHAHRFILAD